MHSECIASSSCATRACLNRCVRSIGESDPSHSLDRRAATPVASCCVRACVSPGRFELPARPSEGCARSTRRGGRVRCTRGRIRTCGGTVNSRLRCQLRHPDRSGRAARATPWGITGSAHAVSSTVRESNPALLLGRQGPSRSDNGTRRDERSKGAASRNCPCASDLASRRASHNTLAANQPS